VLPSTPHRLIAVVALLVAACGGEAASPTPTPPPSEATGASAVPATTGPAASAPSESAAPAPSLAGGGADDLVALLPAEVNGIAFERGGLDFGSQLAGVPLNIDDAELDAFLKSQGKSSRDVRIAVAYPTDTTPQAVGTMVLAIQVRGADPGAWRAWAVDHLASGADRHTVAGKQVYGDEVPGVAAWLYVKGDTAFWAFGFDAKLVEGIIAALP
jgi:hypothetical protein